MCRKGLCVWTLCRAGTHLCGFRPSLCLCVPVRVLYVCARWCRERLPSACAFLRLGMFVPVSVFAYMPVLSMHTVPWVCVTPHPLGSTAHSCGEEGASPSFSKRQRDPGRAWLPLTWYKMLKREVEAGQDCQLPAAPSRVQGNGLLPAPPPGL